MNLETQLLSDPKKKLTNRQRKNFWKLHEKRLTQPWWNATPLRMSGCPALEKANDRRDKQRKPAGYVKLGPEPKSTGEKIIRRLARLSLKRLNHFVNQSARRAASAMYSAQKTSVPTFKEGFEHEQMRQLALFRAGLRMIEIRINPPISNEI